MVTPPVSRAGSWGNESTLSNGIKQSAEICKINCSLYK